MPAKAKKQRPSTAATRRSASEGTGEPLGAIMHLARSLNQLHHQMAASYAPLVQGIIRSRTWDHQQIEHLLDRLLDCACIPDGLALFRSLCRYYFPINPAATASYVHAYRDMWDSEESEKEAEA